MANKRFNRGGSGPNSKAARKKRVNQAKKRISKLIDAGTPFNPAGVSQFTRNKAVSNASRFGPSGPITGGASRIASVQIGAPGTARAPKGGTLSFRNPTPKKRKKSRKKKGK